jgi:hypothetical protein
VLEVDMQILEWAKSEQRSASGGFVLKPDAYRFQLMLDGKLALEEPMVVQDLGTESVHFEWRVD